MLNWLKKKEKKMVLYAEERSYGNKVKSDVLPPPPSHLPFIVCAFIFVSLFLSPTLFSFPHFSEVVHACCLRFRLKYYAFHSHPCFYHHKSRFSYAHNMQQLCLVSFSSEMYDPFLNYTNACKQHSCCPK